jgi:hypothetical protein
MIGEGQRYDILNIKPHRTEVFEFPFDFKTNKTLNVMWGFPMDTIFINVQGNATIRTFIGNFNRDINTKVKYFPKDIFKNLFEK